MNALKPLKKYVLIICLISFAIALWAPVSGQMRQVYVDNTNPNNQVYKLDFYSPSEGYVAFNDWIGYTVDSGRTFTQKPITVSNVDYNGYGVNLTFGFGIKGVKAINRNTIIVYGDYGLVPSILYSTNGGNSYKLIYHSQFNPLQLSGGITDMVFPENTDVGYAVDADRILKTTDKGLTWKVVRTDPGSFFDYLEATDNNHVFALSTSYDHNRLLKTTDGGSSWQALSLPVLNAGKMAYAHFLTPNTGWLNMHDDDNKGYVYKTINGGDNWVLQNDAEATSFTCRKMKFIDENTGYALSDQNTVYKTFNSGATWEPLPRDNDYAYLGYTHNDLQCLTANQLWAGGGHGFLELSTNGGGTPLPGAYFKVDTTGFSVTGEVHLVNYSRTGYTYQWFVNGGKINTDYDIAYVHNVNSTRDAIQLVVSNGIQADTAIRYQNFYPPVIITSFTPATAAMGDIITITGSNFSAPASISFGGVEATDYSVISSNLIKATVGLGASGDVKVATSTGHGSLAGFTFIPPPAITSFTPVSAVAGTTVTITGTNFTGATAVNFGGIAATSFTIVSADTITAVVPSGQSGAVSVTAPGGTASLEGFIALPTITSFTPLNGTQGTILKITGTSLTGVTAVTVGALKVMSFTVNSSTSISAVVSTGATGSVTVTKPGGSASLPGFSWFPPPVITSFSPSAGPAGTSVTINGTGFNAAPGNNIVYFGGVKAIIASASPTSLTVTVPVGATFEPISVTSNNLIGYSDKPFLVTFPEGGSITANSFAATTISIGDNRATQILLSDLDGDGKNDLVVPKYSGKGSDWNGILLYRNKSTVSTVSFAKPVDMTKLDYKEVAVGDLDGDGKPDLAVIKDKSIVTFRNISTPGAISFVASTVLATGNAPSGIAIKDVDGDGKPEIAITLYPDVITSVFRNTSDSANISFAAPINYPVLGGRNILLVDLDSDNKPELIVPDAVDNIFSVLKNNSTKTKISFGAPLVFTGYTHAQMAAGDLDGDGKTDLIAGANDGSKVAIIRNKSEGGNIAFAPAEEVNATSSPEGIAVSDLDGDGKPDIAAALINYNLAVFKNEGAPGNISMAPKTDYTPGSFYGVHMLALGDINGDGKNDAVVVHEGSGFISVYLNNVQPEPFIDSFIPTIGVAGTEVTISGNNFTGVTGVSFGGVPATSFTVNSSTSITAIVGAGASGDVTVTNNYGADSEPGFVFGAPPVITSLSSGFGAVGSNIFIRGNYFSPNPDSNIVYFGSVKAVVTASTDTSVTATVPSGATYQPVSVTTNNLTGYSAQPFSVTFPGGGSSFSAGSFAPRIDRNGGGRGALCDVDGDGKLDLILSGGSAGINIARNTSSPGNISLADYANFNTGAQALGTVTGDLDGDGKPDVVAFNYESQSISVLRNTSSTGNISLSEAVNYLTGPSTTRPSDAVIYDLDADGKPDIIVANYYSQTISVFKNTSSRGNISLAERIDYAVDGYPTGIAINDVDGDGKPEMIVSANGNEYASVYPNNSVPGTISFAHQINFGTGSWPNGVKVSDIDGDNKPDIVIPNINSNTVSILRNLSTGVGNISFAPKQDFATGDGPFSISIADLDGDGKPDITEQNIYSGSSSSILKNTSVPGVLSLQSKVDYLVASAPNWNSIGDIDGDGIPDMVVYAGGQHSIFRNLIGSSTVVEINICANIDTSLSSNIAGSNYQWQQNTGTGFENINDDINFSGINTANLQLINIPAAWNSYEYKCIVNGSQSSSTFRLNITPAVDPAVTISTASPGICAGTTATFEASVVNGGTLPFYQWKRNGINVGTNDPVYSSNTFLNEDAVSVSITSNATCASPAVANSAVIRLNITPAVNPAVTISTPSTNICEGATAIFTATAINEGTLPFYQWKKNGINVGANDPVYNSSGLQNGDAVFVYLTSNAACASAPVVNSDTIIISETRVTPAISITGNTTVEPGQTTIISSLITNGGLSPSYQWQDSTDTHSWLNINGAIASTINYKPVQTGSRIRSVLTSNAACATTNTVTSNVLAFTLNTPADSLTSIRHYPNPVSSMLVIDSLKLSDNWQHLEIRSMNGSLFMLRDISGQTKVTVPVGTLPGGMYIVVLSRSQGKPAHFKIIKQ